MAVGTRGRLQAAQQIPGFQADAQLAGLNCGARILEPSGHQQQAMVENATQADVMSKWQSRGGGRDSAQWRPQRRRQLAQLLREGGLQALQQPLEHRAMLAEESD